MFTSKGSGNIIFTLNSELLGYIWEHIIVDMVGSVGSVDSNILSIVVCFQGCQEILTPLHIHSCHWKCKIRPFSNIILVYNDIAAQLCSRIYIHDWVCITFSDFIFLLNKYQSVLNVWCNRKLIPLFYLCRYIRW